MKKEIWLMAAKKADFHTIGKKFGIDPVTARIIRNRDLCDDSEIDRFLNATLEDLYAPELMKGISEAVRLLKDAVLEKKKIRVIGDYDVDGIMSTYILKRGLQENGALVDAVIPDRIVDGYGLNDTLIKKAAEDGIQVILTCDNGISAAPQIALANSMGMQVIVTDHHEIPFEEAEDGSLQYLIPDAAVVIDPKQPDCKYPFQEICGAVVAMKLMQAFFADFDKKPEDALEEFLEFAAFATIADVMELIDENRILVKYGLLKLNQTKNPGLKALAAVNGLQKKKLSVYHVGFIMGPCLNASGRLDSAERSLELLESRTAAQAAVLAGDLKSLNESRKEMTNKGVLQAEEQIREEALLEKKVLVIYLPECHESLAGIIAGRMKERYGKPVFVLTNSGELVKGSGRSIEKYHMYEELCKCKELFAKFGGHRMAAGLSMVRENVQEFRRKIEEFCTLCPEDYVEKIVIDVPMPFSYVTFELIEQFDKLAPFGNGNARPLFAQKNITFLKEHILGINRNVGKYSIADEYGQNYEITYFGNLEELHQVLEQKKTLAITYYPEINTYRGKKNIQFIMQNYQE